MIRYYKLFDLLNRKNMMLSDLRKILSSSTVAKLRKGQYISGEAIEKICIFLECQPGDIMEVFEEDTGVSGNTILYTKKSPDSSEMIAESMPIGIDIATSDENDLTQRTHVSIE